MKFFILILLISCAQKYQTYHIIDKQNFDKDNYQTPISKKLYPQMRVSSSFCEGQFFFMSNAKKETDLQLNRIVRTLCPNDNYLLNSRLTETWWTTIIYSRSCVDFEAYCPRAD